MLDAREAEDRMRFLRAIPVVHWPRACVAQGVGRLAMLSAGLGLERVSWWCAVLAGALWRGLPSR